MSLIESPSKVERALGKSRFLCTVLVEPILFTVGFTSFAMIAAKLCGCDLIGTITDSIFAKSSAPIESFLHNDNNVIVFACINVLAIVLFSLAIFKVVEFLRDFSFDDRFSMYRECSKSCGKKLGSNLEIVIYHEGELQRDLFSTKADTKYLATYPCTECLGKLDKRIFRRTASTHQLSSDDFECVIGSQELQRLKDYVSCKSDVLGQSVIDGVMYNTLDCVAFFIAITCIGMVVVKPLGVDFSQLIRDCTLNGSADSLMNFFQDTNNVNVTIGVGISIALVMVIFIFNVVHHNINASYHDYSVTYVRSLPPSDLSEAHVAESTIVQQTNLE